MNGGKSHALGKGAPGPTAQFIAALRKNAATQHGKVAQPFDGMQSFKGAACWCKKCAGSMSGKDNHSRMGCSPPSAVYPNCILYKSDVRRLLSMQKRARTLAAPDDGGGGPARKCARHEGSPALSSETVDASATASNQVRTARARAFLGGNQQVIMAMDALVNEVEIRAKVHATSELMSAQRQESERACDAATTKLVERYLPQVERDPAYDSKLYFEAPKPSTCEFVMLGNNRVELVRKPDVDAVLAAGRRMYLIDFDTRAPHQPHGGLRCWRCGSRDLTVGKMTHQMIDRAGIKPCLLADGHVDWLSAKMRTCRACNLLGNKSTLFDDEGGMVVQMSDIVQDECPASPIMAFGRAHVGRGLQDSLDTDPLKHQASATLTTKVVEYGARAHDKLGATYKQLLLMYAADLERFVSDEAWSAMSDAGKAALQSRRNDDEQLGSQFFAQWPPRKDVYVGLDASTMRARRKMSAKEREEVARRAVLSVGGERAADDLTFHAAAKLGFTAAHVTCNENGEIGNAVMIRSSGKFADRKPAIEQFSGRPNVHLKGWATGDCPNMKKEIEAITNARNTGDNRHVQDSSLAHASHFSTLFPRVAEMTKLAFSAPRETEMALVDLLLVQGKINVMLGGKRSNGLQRPEDKFTTGEIERAKCVTFDGKTGAKQGGDYFDRFPSSNIPMVTHSTAVILKKVNDMADEIRELQAAREKDETLTERQKAKTVHQPWFAALARYDQSAQYLQSHDPWRKTGFDTRCNTGELPLWRSCDGTNLVEAANLVMGSWACSNGLGPQYGPGLYLDGIVQYNDDMRRKADTESDFVHHDRGLAMIRNKRSLQIFGGKVHDRLIRLAPDDPKCVIVLEVPPSDRNKAEMNHVAMMLRVRAEAEASRCAQKLPPVFRRDVASRIAVTTEGELVGALVGSDEFDEHRPFAARSDVAKTMPNFLQQLVTFFVRARGNPVTSSTENLVLRADADSESETDETR
ncbi:hypothetical protein M885DRAFT_575652, partial [Pelagophyceae sp. CCMP2097]